MDGLVKKKAVLDAAKSLKIPFRLRNYNKMIPCIVRIKGDNSDGDDVLIQINLKPPDTPFSLRVPKQHVFVAHRSIKYTIPLSLWDAAENFGNLRRVARREEAVYDGDWPAPPIRDEPFYPKGNNAPGVVEHCYDKGVYECDFCYTSENLTLDHRIPKAWKYSARSQIKPLLHKFKIYSQANYQVLCQECHNLKTKFEQEALIQHSPERSCIDVLLQYCQEKKDAKEQ